MIFACQDYMDEQKVKLAVIEFSEYAVVWWDQLTKSRRRSRLPEIMSWTELKGMMRTQFVPSHYYRDLYQRLQTLTQGTRNVNEYHKEMEILMLRADVQEDKEADTLLDQHVLRHVARLPKDLARLSNAWVAGPKTKTDDTN